MSGIIYSRRAQREIDAIQRRLWREAGPRTALKWARRLRQAADALCDHPDRGAVDIEIKRRRLVVAPYLIFSTCGLMATCSSRLASTAAATCRSCWQIGALFRVPPAADLR